MKDELLYLSAAEMLRRFRARTLSPVELMRALVERMERIGRDINPFVEAYWDEALASSHAAETRYANGTARALEGIPLSVKDTLAVRGKRWMCGSLVHRERVADFTDPSVGRLLDAGAILTARSACPEFAWLWTCHSPLHGVTRNPWQQKISSGGSSGGSAAAVAAGLSAISLGSDSAGSIRMPAAMCGVIGYKPPSGRNPESAEDSEDLYCDVGPITRTVEDCVLMQNITAGPHPADHATLRPRLVLPWPLGGVSGMRVAYSLDLGFIEIAPDVRENTLALLGRLRSLGVQITEVCLEQIEQTLNAGDWYGDFLMAEDMAPLLREQPHLLSASLRYVAESCSRVTRAQYFESFRAQHEAWLRFGPILEAHDAFLCPTVATTDVPATLEAWEDISVNGKVAERWVLTLLFNMFRCCPVLALPSGRGHNGVPTGVQLVGRTYDDLTVFQLASALEAQDPWYQDPARRPPL